MSAPTEPRATASEPRLPGRSSSWTRRRYEGTGNTVSRRAGAKRLGKCDGGQERSDSGSVTEGRREATRKRAREAVGSTPAQAGWLPWLGLFVVSQISKDDVAHLARLARLALTDAAL